MKATMIQEISDQLRLLEITKHDNIVYTKYNNRTLKTASVSKFYEVFDFGNWCLDRVIDIMPKLDISNYNLIIQGGLQELILKSDIINIGDKQFQKRLYILSSSDRTRRLQINYALHNMEDDFTFIAEKGSFSKLHTSGVNAKLDGEFEINVDTFDEHLEIMDNILKSDIQFKHVKAVILGDNPKPSQTNKDKLRNVTWTYERRNKVDITDDTYVDTYEIVKIYMRLFKQKDSHIIKRESKRISELTRFSIRKKKLELISKMV